MKRSIRRGLGGFAAVLVVACAVAGCSQSSSTSGTSGSKTTLTEEDYFNTPGQIAALAAYSKAFEAAHPGVTVKRQYVPFADLDAKLLTQAAGQDLPNLLAVDNPFVSTMISTGQVVPISGLKGFSTQGYFPAVIKEGYSGGKYYSLPVAGANSIALIYNIAMLKAANVKPPMQSATAGPALNPSRHAQPKSAPRPSPSARRTQSTSSRVSCPTSPITRSPVTRSNDQRKGLRRPIAQFSFLPTAGQTGLSPGIA